MPGMPKPLWPWLLALLLCATDQLHKSWMLHGVRIAETGPIEIASFFNLVMVWNYGISFGLFQAGSPWQYWLLIGITASITGFVGWWLTKQATPLGRAGCALVIGGAVGNLIDRLIYGAVADFFDVHVAGWHWPAFNIADSAIFVGVCLLICAEWRTAKTEKNA